MSLESTIQPLTVSICILCYNQAEVINSTIESALKQTRPADEILVVDDGSTDQSRERINDHPEVKLVVHSFNRGRTAARNTLLTSACGDVLVYLDGDTLADPTLLEHLLSEYTGVDIGGVGGRGVESNIYTIYDRWRARHATQGGQGRQEHADFLFGLCFSFRRTLMEQVGGFRSVGEDVDISYRIRKLGYRLVYTPLAFVHHVRTDNRRSLMHMLYRWWFGGYIAYKRNGQPAMRIQLGRLLQDLIRHTHHDLFIQKDLGIALINLLVVPTKLRAIIAASVFLRVGALS